MTYMEKIIQEQVGKTVTATIARTTDGFAEEMARELLRDPEVRARYLRLIQKAFDHALEALDREAPDEPPA